MSAIRKNIAIFAFSLVISMLPIYLLAMNMGWGANYSTLISAGFGAFTLLLGLITYSIQYRRHKAAFEEKQKSPDEISPHQSRIIEIDLPFDQAFDLALDALQTLDAEDIPRARVVHSKQHLKIHTAERDMGRIKAGLRAKTMGIQDIVDFSRIEIQLQRIDGDTTRLRIDSQPTNPLEAFDMGRHTHYVNHLAVTIRKESHYSSATQRLADDSTMPDMSDDPSALESDHGQIR